MSTRPPALSAIWIVRQGVVKALSRATLGRRDAGRQDARGSGPSTRRRFMPE